MNIEGQIKIIHTKFSRIIILTNKSGSELGRVDLADGVDLSYFLRELDSDGE